MQPTGSMLQELLINGEVLDIYPLSDPQSTEERALSSFTEALIYYNNVNYHVKFTPDMVPTGEYSVAEDIYSEDYLNAIEDWQEQLLKDLQCGPGDDPDLVKDWNSIDDFSDVEGWEDDEEDWDATIADGIDDEDLYDDASDINEVDSYEE
jgi:hypothetical protein